MTDQTCTEIDCTTAVTDAPDSRCRECGEPYCDEHLWADDRDGYLCRADYQDTLR